MTYDVIITVGDPKRSVRDAMLAEIKNDFYPQMPNTTTTGLGEYADVIENSGVLIYTDLGRIAVDELRAAVLWTLDLYDQEAAGFVVTPAGSNLMFRQGE